MMEHLIPAFWIPSFLRAGFRHSCVLDSIIPACWIPSFLRAGFRHSCVLDSVIPACLWQESIPAPWKNI